MVSALSLIRLLVRLKVDVILTRGAPAALTRTIPVVTASSGDPLATGLVASLARPGANVTGLSTRATDIQGKQLELVRGSCRRSRAWASCPT